MNRPERFKAGRPDEAMPHIGGYARSIDAALCGAEVACGVKRPAWQQDVLRAVLAPASSDGRAQARPYGEGCNGRGKQAAGTLQHYPSLAKLGIGRLETRFRVAQSTACLTHGLRVSPENFSFSLF
ncbi:MAG: hypothetical protein ACK4VI_09850 [Alphaproteobacteria bacterium]